MPLDSSKPTHQPLSIDQLTHLAKISFDSTLSIKSYLRTCHLLSQKAKLHQTKQDELDLAFIYLFRAANTIVQDLPTHPDYNLLSSRSKLRIQAVGIEYLRALAPVKARLAARSNKQPSENHSKDRHSSKNVSIASSTLSPSSPSSKSFPQVLHTSPFPPLSSPSTVSRSISSSRTRCSARDFVKSPSSLSSSPRINHLHSTTSPPTIPQASSDHPSSPDSLNDWTILPSSSGIPILDSWRPLGDKKPHRRLSEPVSHSPVSPTSSPLTSPQFARNPFVWPVELGNGQGQPMSTALPVDQTMKTKLKDNQLRRSTTSRHDLGSSHSPRPHYKKLGLFDNIPFTSHSTTPLNLFDRNLHQPAFNPHRPATSGASSRQTLQEWYSLPDRADIPPRQNFTPSQLSPSSTDPLSHGYPAYLPLSSTPSHLLPFRKSVSNHHVPPLDPLSKLSDSISFSSFKSFIRPRRASLSYPTSKSKSKLSSAPSSSAFGSGTLPNPLSPCSPPPPPRPRRASIGETSTWRWLKGLNSRSPEKVSSKLSDSNVPKSHMNPLPLEDRNNIQTHTHAEHIKTGSYPSLDAQYSPTFLTRTSSSSISSPKQVKHPPSPPKDPRMMAPTVMKTPAQSSFKYQSPNRSNSNSQRPITPLRSMKCPKDLVGAFLAMAEPETEKGIELCGLLLGKTSSQDRNVLIIDTLLIPKQISSPDTCHTINEDELFKFQDEMGLMTLGWIHTHPTQTCFLSSLDLHTHLSYQLMLPEAVAIVCSPKKEPSLGVFRLIDPDGIESILNCKESSSFHPHSLDSKLIYCDANVHFRLVDDQAELDHMKLDIRDLRS